MESEDIEFKVAEDKSGSTIHLYELSSFIIT